MNNQDYIIQNAIELSDGTILCSFSHHDCKTYQNNGDFWSVDGGQDYLKRSYGTENKMKHKDLVLHSSSTMDEILDSLICEATNMKWKDMSVSQIKKEKAKILDSFNNNSKKYYSHTSRFVELHLRVADHWLTIKEFQKNKPLITGSTNV